MLLFQVAHRLIVKEKIDKKDIPRFILCGLFGVAINQLLFFKGLSLTNPVNAALMMTTNPLQVMLFAFLIINERISAIKLAGIILGFTGAILIIASGGNFSFSSQTFVGDLCIFFNSLSYALFIVLVKPLLSKYRPLTVMKWVFTFGVLVVIPFGYNEFLQVEWNSIVFVDWLRIIFVVIGTTFIAYLLNTFALQRLSPSVVSAYIYSQPVFATLMGIIIGTGYPHLIHYIAAIFIFSGIYLAGIYKAKTN
ncbi:MAG: EamA family transporter [Bacteroidetes bacterium]|nr:EamA family transporter [Bacteroidota bacterium]